MDNEANIIWTKLQKAILGDYTPKPLQNWAFDSDKRHRNQVTQFCNNVQIHSALMSVLFLHQTSKTQRSGYPSVLSFKFKTMHFIILSLGRKDHKINGFKLIFFIQQTINTFYYAFLFLYLAEVIIFSNYTQKFNVIASQSVHCTEYKNLRKSNYTI